MWLTAALRNRNKYVQAQRRSGYIALLTILSTHVWVSPDVHADINLMETHYFKGYNLLSAKKSSGTKFSNEIQDEQYFLVMQIDAKNKREDTLWRSKDVVTKVIVSPNKENIAVLLSSKSRLIPFPSLVILDHEGNILKEVTPEDKNKGVMDFAWHSDSNRFAYVIGEPLIAQEVFNYTRGGVYVSSLEEKEDEHVFPLGFEVMWSSSEDALYIYDEWMNGEIVYQYIPSSRKVVYATCRDFFFSPDRKHYYSKPREAFAIFNAYKIDSEYFSEDGQLIIRYDSLFFPQAISKQDRNPEHAKMAYRLIPLFWLNNEHIAVRSPMSVKGKQTAYLLNIRTMQLSKTDGIILEKGHRENEVLLLTENGYQLVNADSFSPASIDELPVNPGFESPGSGAPH